jgi:hypothetical protein
MVYIKSGRCCVAKELSMAITRHFIFKYHICEFWDKPRELDEKVYARGKIVAGHQDHLESLEEQHGKCIRHLPKLWIFDLNNTKTFEEFLEEEVAKLPAKETKPEAEQAAKPSLKRQHPDSEKEVSPSEDKKIKEETDA